MHIYIMYEVPRNMVDQINLGACVWIFYISIFKVVNKIIFYQSDLNPSNLLMVGDQGMKRKILFSHHLISSWLIHIFSSLFSSPSLFHTLSLPLSLVLLLAVLIIIDFSFAYSFQLLQLDLFSYMFVLLILGFFSIMIYNTLTFYRSQAFTF